MLTLYHAIPSRSSIARWMLEEVGEPYDIKLLDLRAGEGQTPAYLAVNPMGKVPAIDHDGVIITEAAAICTYLADAFPKAGLNVPVGDKRRGLYLKWLFFGPSCVEPAITDRAFPRKEEAQRSTLGHGDYDTVIDVLAKGVAGGPYLLGGQFTAADVIIGSGLRWGMMFKLIPERPEFNAYVGRLNERPALKRAQEKDAALSTGGPLAALEGNSRRAMAFDCTRRNRDTASWRAASARRRYLCDVLFAGPQPCRCRAWRGPAHRLGHVILFPRRAGRADRGRHRVAAQLCRRRRFARPADRGTDLAAGWPRHCRARRPAGPGDKLALVRGRPVRDRARAIAVGLSRRLDRRRRGDGHGPLRCGLCRARPALRHSRARADHGADVVRRICRHGVLAARRVSGRDIRLAQRLLRLCRAASADRSCRSC